jgi:oligosaccharyltransferase complex subunit delta (ribophorin II)
MRLLQSLIPSLLLGIVGVAQAASSWGFDEAVISVSSKGAGVGAQFKDKYAELLYDPTCCISTLTDADSLTMHLFRSR